MLNGTETNEQDTEEKNNEHITKVKVDYQWLKWLRVLLTESVQIESVWHKRRPTQKLCRKTHTHIAKIAAIKQFPHKPIVFWLALWKSSLNWWLELRRCENSTKIVFELCNDKVSSKFENPMKWERMSNTHCSTMK